MPFLLFFLLFGFGGFGGGGSGRQAMSQEPDDDGPDMPPATSDDHLIRLGDWETADGEIDPSLPNARVISNEVARQEGDMPNSAGLSDLFWVWGQFIDHDLSLTPAEGGAFHPIPVPDDDPVFEPGTIIPFTRVEPIEGGEGVYANDITALMDGSMVYGSDAAATAALRDGAYLRLDEGGHLPEDGEGGVLAGDVRVAENVALTSMHTIFAREHNRLVDELREDAPLLDEEALFAAARARVEAEIQAITYNDWLPLLVGESAVPAYEGYDPDTDPSISIEFSTAAFRFGHTLLSSELERLNEDGSEIEGGALSLREAFFNPDAIAASGGVAPIMRGLAASSAQELDTRVVEDVRSFLVDDSGNTGLDLAALNIMRGRDLGVESYNDLRETIGFERVESFSEITSDSDLAARLETLYGDVDRVDAWVGGLAEDPLDGGILGESFAFVVVDQFVRTRDGDESWATQNGLISAEELADIQEMTLADIIIANSDVEVLQDNVFLAEDRSDLLMGEMASDEIPSLADIMSLMVLDPPPEDEGDVEPEEVDLLA